MLYNLWIAWMITFQNKSCTFVSNVNNNNVITTANIQIFASIVHRLALVMSSTIRFSSLCSFPSNKSLFGHDSWCTSYEGHAVGCGPTNHTHIQTSWLYRKAFEAPVLLSQTFKLYSVYYSFSQVESTNLEVSKLQLFVHGRQHSGSVRSMKSIKFRRMYLDCA